MPRVVLALGFFVSAAATVETSAKVLQPDGEVEDLPSARERDALLRRHFEVSPASEVENLNTTNDSESAVYIANNQTDVAMQYEASVLKEHEEATWAIGLASFGTLAVCLGFFYLTKLPIESINLAAWEWLSGSICLFTTVLAFMSSRKGWKLQDHHWKDWTIAMNVSWLIVRFLLSFFGLTYASLRLKLNGSFPRSAIALSTLNVYIIGFAGADAGAELLRMNPWSESRGMYLLGVCICMLFYSLMMFVNLAAQKKTLKARRRDGYEPDMETELIESFTFTGGFLFSMWARYGITGYVPGSKDVAIVEDDCVALFGLCLLFTSAYIVAAILLHPRLDDETYEVKYRRGGRFAIYQLAMITGWLWFYCGEWQTWKWITSNNYASKATYKMSAMITLALNSFVFDAFFLAVLGLIMRNKSRKLSDCKELISAIVLQTGFSLETAYYAVAIDGFRQKEDDQKRKEDLIYIWITLLVLLPAWYLFIVPETKDFKKWEAIEAAKEKEAEKDPKKAEAAKDKEEKDPKKAEATKEKEEEKDPKEAAAAPPATKASA